jgi:hypothetical protein
MSERRPAAIRAALGFAALVGMIGCGGGGGGGGNTTEPPPDAVEASPEEGPIVDVVETPLPAPAPTPTPAPTPGPTPAPTPAPTPGPTPTPTTPGGAATVGVYLQNVSATEASIVTAGDRSVTVNTMRGLAPDTEYPYEAKDASGKVVHTGRLHTAPVAGARPVVFGVIGDTGYHTTITPQLRVRDSLLRSDPPLEMVITTGDNVYYNGEWERYRPAVFEPYAASMNRIPWFFSIGNHDTYTETGKPFDTFFVTPANNEQKTDRYYSFDWGDVHLIALQLDGLPVSEGSPQVTWLQNDLARTPPTMWKVVFFHYNLFGEGDHGDATQYHHLRPIFQAGGVNVAFMGHEHAYERFKPMDGGIHYLVVAGGGAPFHLPFNAGSTRLAYGAQKNHYLRVTADAHTMSIQAIGTDDRVFDTLTLTK